MLKARADNNLIFGLSKLNLEKLREGKPIMINLKEMGFDEGKILIFYEEDEATMLQKFREAGIHIPG